MLVERRQEPAFLGKVPVDGPDRDPGRSRDFGNRQVASTARHDTQRRIKDAGSRLERLGGSAPVIVRTPSSQLGTFHGMNRDMKCTSCQGWERTGWSCDEDLAYGRRCQEVGVVPSIGGAGRVYDNAITKAFFATLETELLDRHRFIDRGSARRARFDHIE
jgi:hypothetical protein